MGLTPKVCFDPFWDIRLSTDLRKLHTTACLGRIEPHLPHIWLSLILLLPLRAITTHRNSQHGTSLTTYLTLSLCTEHQTDQSSAVQSAEQLRKQFLRGEIS